MSVAGNASTSRNARMAMYCAVHSPIPRMLRRRPIASSILPDGRKRFGSDVAAFASVCKVRSRAPGIFNPRDSTVARRSAVGKTCVKVESFPSAMLSPCKATSCPASRRAAATLICCPRTARTANSKPSHPPGARRPGRAATKGARSGSALKWPSIVSMSAPRSNKRRTRLTISGRHETLGK